MTKSIQIIGPFTTAGKTVDTLAVDATKPVEYSVNDGVLAVQAVDPISGEVVTGVADASQATLESLNAVPTRVHSEALHFPSCY